MFSMWLYISFQCYRSGLKCHKHSRRRPDFLLKLSGTCHHKDGLKFFPRLKVCSRVTLTNVETQSESQGRYMKPRRNVLWGTMQRGVFCRPAVWLVCEQDNRPASLVVPDLIGPNGSNSDGETSHVGCVANKKNTSSISQRLPSTCMVKYLLQFHLATTKNFTCDFTFVWLRIKMV